MSTKVPTQAKRDLTLVAVVGNPNTGKTTLFNVLTGFRQRVGNYPGVTVEKKTGFLRDADGGRRIEVVDLPGAYSLAARSADEAVVLEVLIGRREGARLPDLIIVVADATNLARNLFFASQILEIGIPTVMALSMVDLAEAQGLRIDSEALGRELGIPVVPVVATKHVGIDRLRSVIGDSVDGPTPRSLPPYPQCVRSELEGLRGSIGAGSDGSNHHTSSVELLQTLLDPGGYHEARLTERYGSAFRDELVERRERIQAAGESLAEVEARVRYGWIDQIIERAVTRVGALRTSRSEMIDRALTHRVFGSLFLLVLMGACFQSIYAWAGPLMDAIDATFTVARGWVMASLPPGALQSLLANGVIAGAGAVLVFLPQILILFLFISILEDCGYMARVAFLLDRWMGLLGLNGKSFIPLLSSFACAVPGIMATRTIEDRRDRFVTILIAPLMSCSARLPVYMLLIAAFVPDVQLLKGVVGLQAVTLLGMYGVGVGVAVMVALILKRTVLPGAPHPFLMELPTYKWPSPGTVLYRVYEQGKAFCVSAGTIIFAMAITVWALGYYPRPASITAEHDAQRVSARQAYSGAELDDRLAEINSAEAGSYLRHSLLGRMGRWIEPVVKPLGWDWRIGTAAIASFPAREVVIATMGTIYNLGGDHDETSSSLRAQLHAAKWPDGRPVFNIAVALSIMVFFALCCQCGATLATIRRETNSWRWPIFTFCYMTALAYIGAFVTYQTAVRFI